MGFLAAILALGLIAVALVSCSVDDSISSRAADDVCLDDKGERRKIAEEDNVGLIASVTLQENYQPLTLITNGILYSPTPMGRQHVLLAGSSIVAVFNDSVFPWSSLVGLPGVKVIDVNGAFVVPGLIDIHVHIIGGGGEVGPASKTPEAPLSNLIKAGITTVVGVLGTDCVSRSLEELRVKASALKSDGLTAYIWSGCYRVPSLTLTGSLVRDLVLVDEVVGAGEIAISDHRGSWPSRDALLNLVSDARVGGMLSGKAGLLYTHMGQAPTMFDPLWDLINISKGAIPITQILPTHVTTRGPALTEEAEKWAMAGGRIDVTSDQEGEHAAFDALVAWGKRDDFPLERVSLSSDGFGSLPKFDAYGKLLKYGIASPDSNLKTIQRLVLEAGKVGPGMDGDVLVLDPQKLELQYVFASGQMVKSPTWTKQGWFEP